MSNNHHPMMQYSSSYTASAETLLHIPRAQDWSKGVAIHEQGNTSAVVFRVLENLNRGSLLEPKFRTILTNADGEQVVALVKLNRRSIRPHWCIYLATSAVTGCPRRSASGDLTSGDRDQLPPNMILYGVLHRNGDFTTTGCRSWMGQDGAGDENDDDPLAYQCRSVRGGKVCCCSGSSHRVMDVFYTTNDDDESAAIAFVRNQFDETMKVAAGENLLVAAALCYAIDRQVKPLGSMEERKQRIAHARRQAEILGLKNKSSRRHSGEDVVVVPLKDKTKALRIVEESAKDGSDAIMITLAEASQHTSTTIKADNSRQRSVSPAGLANSNEHTTIGPASFAARRRQKQFSEPILELEGDSGLYDHWKRDQPLRHRFQYQYDASVTAPRTATRSQHTKMDFVHGARVDTDDPSLANHTVCMRRVLKYCVEQIQELPTSLPKISSRVVQDASETPSLIRQEALNGFSNRQQQSDMFSIPEYDSWHNVSPCYFRREFHRANLPCKIKHATAPYFTRVREEWTATHVESISSPKVTVNHEWFLEKLGADALVPVRFSPLANVGECKLDEQGRANETCQTVHMPLHEWMSLLERNSPLPNRKDIHIRHQYYLKDWHLLKLLEKNENATNQVQDEPLYTVPPHFGPDLLNDYLSFGPSDYKFVYWGPKHSCTGLHSDVMGSFSWSYNVRGTKEWTFHLPTIVAEDAHGDESSTATTMTVQQLAGECIFVPAGWLHSVVNIDDAETLSINHNWITTANLDIVWKTLQTEMVAIDIELAKWSNDDEACDGSGSVEAKESMLLGCVGLNVTAYLLIVVLGIVNVLRWSSDDEQYDDHFDLLRLGETLRTILDANDELCLEERLSTALASKKLATITLHVVSAVLKRIEIMSTSSSA
ncbi:hypothetical protein MPSEU_000835800 [Mayamaea pseudoterrestris]|nr:hypothetical protein MPSEU_000835800 [Mayamaea pseudoterrestris]